MAIATQPAFSFGEALVLSWPFDTPPWVERAFDVSRDGKRFLGVLDATQDLQSPGSQAPQLRMVLNWTEELKAKLPANGARN